MNDADQTGALTVLIAGSTHERYTAFMINLLLMTLSLANITPVKTAQVRPCVWPNTCKTAPAPVVAQFTSCVWPNRCVKAAAPLFTL
jgi:hypothetical protein